MPLKKSDKNKEFEMEKEIFPILAINNGNLKPYIDVFTYQPENITQQPLGILAGFFEVGDYSEDSAYIVNFLNSVARKEYYMNHRRPVPESFDSMLHKINIALSELAKHGNINWLGKIDSAICALEKNSIHFTVTGNAKILLWRKDSLIDIAQGLSPESPDPHPLKTFTNVSSGRLEKNDKLIITSPDLLNILSLQDIQKNLLRFDSEKFNQFLKTAATNELDLTGIIVIDIKEPEKQPKKELRLPEKTEERKPVNAFSQNAFTRKNEATPSIKKRSKEVTKTVEKYEPRKEYTDEKTGHIYIAGEEEKEKTDSVFMGEHSQILKEKLHDLFYSLRVFFARQFSNFLRKTKSVFISIVAYDYRGKISLLKQALENKKKISIKKDDAKKTTSEPANDKQTELKIDTDFQGQGISQKDLSDAVEKIDFTSKITEHFHSFLFKFKLWIKKTRIKLKSAEYFNRNDDSPSKTSFLMTALGKMVSFFFKLSLKQKAISAIIILVVIIMPITLTRNGDQKKAPPSISTMAPIEQSPEEKLSGEKNIVFVKETKPVFPENSLGIFPLEKGLYAVLEDKVSVKTEDGQEGFSWPKEYGKAKAATYMDDLGLIFLATDARKIISFSPISKDFKDNSISIPQDAQLGLISTYLTYLYVIDINNSKIYRYPRAEGGFGNSSNWLKKELDLSGSVSVAIDENLYLADKLSVKKFFRGEVVEFKLEDSKTKVSFDLIHTTPDISSLYVLDSVNSRIIKFNKEGSLEKQYHHKSISLAKSFSVDENSRKIYLASDSGVSYFETE